MRVGVRRLRVAARIAQKAGLPSMSEKLVDELRWLWKVLGASRDVDVFETETWPQIQPAAGAEPNATREFTAHLARLRVSAHRDVRRALDSRRFQLIMLSLSWIATLQHDAIRSGPRKPDPRHLAKRMLSRRAKRLTHVDTDRLTDARRHRLRIDGKKLRYLAEFFAGLYVTRHARRYLRRLEALQTALGGLNDLAVMHRWVANATAMLPAREQAVVMRICNDYGAIRAPVLATQFRKVWPKFAKIVPFWA
jgi:CHAD domain-containing protein